MGIKSFFGAMGSGIRKGWDWTKGATRKAIDVGGRILKPTLNIAHKAAGALATMPGTIGAISKAIYGGGELIKNFVNQLPDSSAKDKLSSLVDRGREAVSNVGGKVLGGVNAANRFVQNQVIPTVGLIEKYGSM